jgi:hypothetical protein
MQFSSDASAENSAINSLTVGIVPVSSACRWHPANGSLIAAQNLDRKPFWPAQSVNVEFPRLKPFSWFEKVPYSPSAISNNYHRLTERSDFGK